MLIAIERLLRGRARYNQSLARGDAVEPAPPPRLARLARGGAPRASLLLVVFVLPVAQLVAWSLETIADGPPCPTSAPRHRNTALLGRRHRGHRAGHRDGPRLRHAAPAVARSSACSTAAVDTRVRDSRARSSPSPCTCRSCGSTARFVDVADVGLRPDIELVFTGSILGLVFAYLVRFNALAFLAVESRMNHIDPKLDDAARSLGADRGTRPGRRTRSAAPARVSSPARCSSSSR